MFIFFFLGQRLNEVTWDEKNIVVMNSVVINPPYNVSSCHGRSDKENQHTIEHVKKIVTKINKFYLSGYAMFNFC